MILEYGEKPGPSPMGEKKSIPAKLSGKFLYRYQTLTLRVTLASAAEVQRQGLRQRIICKAALVGATIRKSLTLKLLILDVLNG